VCGSLEIPSLANGYPNSLIHIYQCLSNAARLGLKGVVAEFGMFQGGTTMFMSRMTERLGMTWRIIGFDTFSGFPPRRSPLDMYDHPDCAKVNLTEVRAYLSGRAVEIVPGDIEKTRHRLAEEDIVMTFMDTDNFTPSSAALDIVQDRTVVGGAIVFDHYTGVDRYRYTLGERMAAKRLVDDPRYFNLHGTGVFVRQR
jgi:O-methyltransferase